MLLPSSANLSAASFPSIPQWLGHHRRVRAAPLCRRAFKWHMMLSSVLVAGKLLWVKLDTLSMADLESVMMRVFLTLGWLSMIVPSAWSMAVISAWKEEVHSPAGKALVVSKENGPLPSKLR